MNNPMPQRLNGIDTRQIGETVAAIRKDPTLAKFEFRASNRWIDGGANRSTILGFHGAGREDDSRTVPFVFVNGEPPVLFGNNEGANPVEFLLHAMAGCITTTLVAHAAARGIRVEKVATELDGDVDVRGLLGLDESLTPGYSEIRIRMDVEADCSDEELADLMAFAQAHSPVIQSVMRPVPVKVERVKSGAAAALGR